MGGIGEGIGSIIGGLGGLFGGKSSNSPERWGGSMQDLGMGDLAYYMSLFGDPVMGTYFNNNKDASQGWQNTFGTSFNNMGQGGNRASLNANSNPFGYGVQQPTYGYFGGQQPEIPKPAPGGMSLQGGGGLR